MRKDIGANNMNTKVKIVSLLLAILALFGFSSCSKSYSDDVVAIAGYLQYFDRPEDVAVNKIEKCEFENEIIYYISWTEYQELKEEEIELLVVFYPETQTTKTAFFLDMEYGMHPDIKALWDSRATKAISSYTYSAEETKQLIVEVKEYCSKWQSVKFCNKN